MESKKQLVIIPPMSEALKKLNEVLEGISTDENIDISIIDDLKELSQFLATTGQCLILSSSAKKCAQFLQENRFVIAKNHAKVILFTPKEIPAKTLVKFTKLGLTESILENSPPKTFLYKVKLLLRSIKSVKTIDEKDREVIRSMTEAKPHAEEEKLVEKDRPKSEMISEDFGALKDEVNTEENVIDYGSNLKGKIRPQNETNDTNWKSERKADINIDLNSEENMKTESGDQESIDMYYRNKRKKDGDDVVELDAFGRFKKPKTLEEEVEEEEKERNSMPDIIDEGIMKEKRLKQRDIEEESNKKEKSIELDITAAKKSKDLTLEELEAEFEQKRKKKVLDPDLEEATEEQEDTKKEDLGGYLKGKLKAESLEDAEEEYVDKKTYENSDTGNDDPDNIELDLIAAGKKKKQTTEEESSEDNVHDGVVDHIENNMFGDAGTVEQIRTRMHGKSDSGLSEEEELDDLIESLRKRAQEEKDEEESSKNLNIPPEKEENEKERTKSLSSEKEDKDYTPSLELDNEPGSKKSREHYSQEKEAKERKDTDSNTLEEADTGHERAKGQTLEKDKGFGLKKLDDTSAEAGRQNDMHNGKADKIDTYMRGGNAKKSEQNWDNLTDRHDSIMAEPKAKRAVDEFSAKADKNFGEESVIDYRKMKEEFELMARTSSSASLAQAELNKDTNLRADEDNGSFKVVEIDPKCLDFSINIQNAIYQKDIKAKQIFKMIATELLEKYHAASVFYTYKQSDKKFTEVFNIATESGVNLSENYSVKLSEFKNNPELFSHFQDLTMTTWRCPEIIKDGAVWEDVELPSWAAQELTNKSVELIFPYFDGLDRMGLAVIFLPDGVKIQEATALLVSMELARTLFLDTIERYKVVPLKEVQDTHEDAESAVPEKKNILSFFSGLFGRKKAG
jgi:hypothetical protein